MVWIQTNFTAEAMNKGQEQAQPKPVVVAEKPAVKKKTKPEVVAETIEVVPETIEAEEVAVVEPEAVEPEAE